jgi:hypothetical protein
MTKKSLVSEKLALLKVIEDKKNKKIFYNKASLNAFVNRVKKAGSFKKLDELNNIINYIKENKIIYQNKIFKNITDDIKVFNKMKDDKFDKIINFNYVYHRDSLKNPQTEIYKTIINMINKKPNNIIKVSITFPNYPKLDDKLEAKKYILNKSTKNKLRSSIFWLIMLNSDKSKFEKYYNIKSNRVYNVKVKISSFPIITGFSLSQQYRISQQFKENNNTLLCVPTAIKNFYEYKKNKVSASSAKKYKSLIKKIENPIYNKPYTINDLELLAKEFNLGFTITDFINDDIIINSKRGILNNIQLFNTKFNHLENYNNEIVHIDESQVKNILNDNKYYTKISNKIYTKDKTYIIRESNFSKEFKNFKKQYDININYLEADSKEAEYINNYYMSIHQILNKKMYNQFIKEVEEIKDNTYSYTDYGLDDGLDDNKLENITHDKQPSRDDMIKQIENKLFKEIDLISAYYNLTNNSKYGVPSNAFLYYDDINNLNIEKHIEDNFVGYYTVFITSQNDQQKMTYLFGKPQLEIVLTTPQIIILKNNKVDFVIKNCLIAPAIKIKFDKKTLETDDNQDIKIYCKMAGIMMKQEINKHISIKTDKPENLVKLFNNNNIKKSKENDKENDKDKKDIIDGKYCKDKFNYIIDGEHIDIIENQNKTLKHIGFFIHSFVSAEIMNLILTNNCDDIVGVKLDSVIVKKDAIIKYDENIYKIKKPNLYNLIENGSDYIKPFIESKEIINNCKSLILNNEIVYKCKILLQGKGGSGKTQSIINNIKYSNFVYGALAWTRCEDFKKEGNNNKIIVSSLPRLTGENCEKIKLSPFTKYIILDELTLINESIIKKIISLYPSKRFIFIGDIDEDGYYYQCSLSEDLIKGFSVLNPVNYDLQIIKYLNNYRFDYILNEKLDSLRQFMRKNSRSNNKFSLLNQYIKENFKECFINKNQVNYNNFDFGISGYQENKRDFAYTQYFINNGATPKYYINKTVYYNDIIKGSESYDKYNHKNQEIRLFQSIHSTQGKTIKDGQLLIILERNFDYNLYYTALSRARRISQIKIINGFETNKTDDNQWQQKQIF